MTITSIGTRPDVQHLEEHDGEDDVEQAEQHARQRASAARDRRRARRPCVSSRIALLEGERLPENRSRRGRLCGGVGLTAAAPAAAAAADDLRRRRSLDVVHESAPSASMSRGPEAGSAGRARSRRSAAAGSRTSCSAAGRGGDLLADLDVRRVPPAHDAPSSCVKLPPPGEHSNTKRYSVAIVGAGFHGILASDSTRIRGLVSIADIAAGCASPSPRDVRRTVRSRSGERCEDLRRLDDRADPRPSRSRLVRPRSLH